MTAATPGRAPDFLMISFCDEHGAKLTEVMILPGGGHKVAIPSAAEHMHVDTAYKRPQPEVAL